MLGSAERQHGHRRRHADRRHAAGNKDCHGRDHLASGVSAWTCPRGMAQDSAVRPASRGWLTSPSPPAAGGAATPRCRRRSPRAYRALPESVPDTNGSSPSRSLTSWKAALRGVSGRTGHNAQQQRRRKWSCLNRAARGKKTEHAAKAWWSPTSSLAPYGAAAACGCCSCAAAPPQRMITVDSRVVDLTRRLTR